MRVKGTRTKPNNCQVIIWIDNEFLIRFTCCQAKESTAVNLSRPNRCPESMISALERVDNQHDAQLIVERLHRALIFGYLQISILLILFSNSRGPHATRIYIKLKSL